MKITFRTTLIALFSFLICLSRSAAKDDSPSAEALVEHARAVQVLDRAAQPLQIKAEVVVAGDNGTAASGNFLLEWVLPTEWREEIHFANYERIRVRDNQGYWQKSTLDYQPMLIYELSGMLHVKDVLRIREVQTLGKPKSRERDGIREKCVDVKWPHATDRTLCFDDSNGALVAIEYPEHDHQAPPVFSRIEYGSFHAVGSKLIPYEARGIREGKVAATVKVVEASEMKEVKISLFEPPKDSTLWQQCDDMQDAAPLAHAPIDYPAAARAGHFHGRVILYGVIEPDGSLSHVTVIQGANAEINTAVLNAVRHWRYKPAQCSGNPIRTETSAFVDFWF